MGTKLGLYIFSILPHSILLSAINPFYREANGLAYDALT